MVAIIFVIIGGFKFIVAQGNPDKVAKARNTLANALVGALIAILASRVVGYIAGIYPPADRTATYGLLNAQATGSVFGTVINILLTLVGAVCVLMITISGIQFIVSSGNPDKVAKARNSIYYALLGLVIAIFAASIVNLIVDKLA